MLHTFLFHLVHLQKKQPVNPNVETHNSQGLRRSVQAGS